MRKIVVGYDGSAPSRRALERAAELARDGAQLVVVSVTPVTFTSLGMVAPEESERAEHRRQADSAREILAAKGVEARAIELAGIPADVIVALAKDEDADLVIVGTHGRNIAERLVLGSVSQGVLHHAPCDVMVVR